MELQLQIKLDENLFQRSRTVGARQKENFSQYPLIQENGLEAFIFKKP